MIFCSVEKRCSFPILSVDDIQVFVSSTHISYSEQKQTYKVKYISQDKPTLFNSKVNITHETTHEFLVLFDLIVSLKFLGCLHCTNSPIWLWATIWITISSGDCSTNQIYAWIVSTTSQVVRTIILVALKDRHYRS